MIFHILLMFGKGKALCLGIRTLHGLRGSIGDNKLYGIPISFISIYLLPLL